MSWAGRCSLGVCSSSSACGAMAGAAPGLSSKLLSSPLPFLDQPILPLYGTGDSVPGGQCSHSSFLKALPSTPQGKRCTLTAGQDWTPPGCKKGRAADTQIHTATSSSLTRTQPLQNVLARKIHMKLGQLCPCLSWLFWAL